MIIQSNTIYILHKNGANSHYTALNHLLINNDSTLEYREFSVFSNLFKSIFSLNGKLFKKQLINFGFIINLLCSKNKKIVLGIAPFDSKLTSILVILKNHQVFYHTSWTHWDKSFHPKQKNNTSKTYKIWRQFLEEKCKHIFTVTKQSKNQLLTNYNLHNEKISVVYHALDSVFETEFTTNKKPLSFIYFGRLVPQKGLKEVLDFFSKQKKARLTIIGDGKEKELVKSIADQYDTIEFIPYTSNKHKLVKLLSTQEYLVLNSKRNNKWEELFGLAIIESMAQGVIPIATNHSGPKEIITKDVGFLCDEGNITSVISERIKINYFDKNMSEKAKEKAKYYLEESIAQRWKIILN